ncbi:glutathione synthetase-like isoform X2 [Nilaparvata lugens]|uniref:glutathione synthetase-like isoform X2 n=1 Tax=Nilaparvata lugens TaxID=108931 RepID=UPI00193DAB6F|nr:glutathione synthetase-like isoform X2 [Nilaparvata lugens]
MSDPRLPSCLELPNNLDELNDLIEKAKDWALMHGAGMRSKTNFSMDSLQFAPFCLVPSVFPRKEFEKAVAIQETLNELIHKVAFCHEFLEESLRDSAAGDSEFTGRLYKIYETVRKEGFNPRLTLGSVRSDVMLETACCKSRMRSETHKCSQTRTYCCLKQVEFNTIAAGFLQLGPISGQLHRFILQEMGHIDKLKNLPENNALAGASLGLIEAWKLFGNKQSVILIVIEDVVMNICDQRFLEFKIGELCPEARTIRRTLTDINKRARLDDHKNLIIDGFVVAVAYLRTGYTPELFANDGEWDALLTMERSSAIKCPSVQYHLAGTKKVQQLLAKPGVLERFITDPQKVKAVRELFTGLYAFDFDESGEKAIDMAIENPERFVLKPQREGGGNNVYGTKIRDLLSEMRSSKERTGWILMDRIVPPAQENIIVRVGKKPASEDIVSELGIFGIIIGDAQKIVYNKQVGHMLRSKTSTADEGGVAAGFGCLDSPYLVDYC